MIKPALPALPSLKEVSDSFLSFRDAQARFEKTWEEMKDPRKVVSTARFNKAREEMEYALSRFRDSENGNNILNGHFPR